MHYYKRFSPKCRIWYDEAAAEKNIHGEIDYRYVKYPMSFYKKVDKFSKNKKYNYCFIGSYLVDQATSVNRKWIIDFIKKHFNKNSYLQFTDTKSKSKLSSFGSFDYTHRRVGFVPKERPVHLRNYFDKNYYQRMCESKFTLCPSGDSFWSMRFYEALMCKSIPIVFSKDETFRSEEESLLDYKYYLASDPNPEYRQDWADHNYDIFLKYHTFDSVSLAKRKSPPKRQIRKPQYKRAPPKPQSRRPAPKPQPKRAPPKPQAKRAPPKPQARRPAPKPQAKRAPPKPQARRPEPKPQPKPQQKPQSQPQPPPKQKRGVFVKLHPTIKKQMEHIRRRNQTKKHAKK
jgi:hypothetical protein